MKPQFHQTVNILVQAYLNDELEHRTCSACAVGNIVAAAIGTKPAKVTKDSPIIHDNNSFANGHPAYGGWYCLVINNHTSEDGEKQVQATGYSVEDLKRIEYAFETAPGDPDKNIGYFKGRTTNPEWMFNGLMAVVDILAEIHNVNLEVKESAKMLFAKP